MSQTPLHHVVLLGPPGAGKGTMGQYLAANFNLAYTSTGDILRADPIWAPRVAAGELADSVTINALTQRTVTGQPVSRLWDGNLRRAAQALFFLELLHRHDQPVLMIADFRLANMNTSWERAQHRAAWARQAGKAVRPEDVDRSIFERRYQNLVEGHQQVMAVLRRDVPHLIVPINAMPSAELVYVALKTAYRERLHKLVTASGS